MPHLTLKSDSWFLVCMCAREYKDETAATLAKKESRPLRAVNSQSKGMSIMSSIAEPDTVRNSSSGELANGVRKFASPMHVTMTSRQLIGMWNANAENVSPSPSHPRSLLM
jgi:hypothetical protein